ncbi:MAG: flagellar hook-basal body complex protein FliE [Paraclostridium sp.]|uniref:flagellar hook-basal body complex protein FliE n=1 Tax=Paraclostridium sp. TaxID=2023273 RepID=UPI003F31E847
MSGVGAINAVNNISTTNNALMKTTKSSESESSFSNIIENALHKVNDKQVDANNKIEGLIKGDNVAMHDVMMAAQESQLSMQLMVEVRNKVYEAYQELNRVQL